MIPGVISVDETSKEVEKTKKLRDFSFPSLFLCDRKDSESAARQIDILPLILSYFAESRSIRLSFFFETTDSFFSSQFI